MLSKTKEQKVAYTENKGILGKEKWKEIILEHISNHKSASRIEIDNLLFKFLPAGKSEEQKKRSVHNLMQEMVKESLIENIGTRKISRWVKKQ